MVFPNASCEVALSEVDGQVRIADTRIPLDTVVGAFRQGASPEEIVQDFPALDLASVYAVIGFYLQQREAVDRYLQSREAVAERIGEENRRQFRQNDLRERLLARRSSVQPQ